MRELRAQLVREALERAGGKVKPAARDLGVSVQTFKRWMADMGLRPMPPSIARRQAEAAERRRAAGALQTSLADEK